MIQVQALAFGTFAAAEPLNRAFAAGHPKLRLTVDTEIKPGTGDRELLGRLTAAFPGLSRHECRAPAGAVRTLDGAAGIEGNHGVVLLESQSSVNQAHILEHILLELLSTLDRERRLSGVTCAYQSPPERNDIFVECSEERSGRAAVRVAVEAVNAALAGGPLAPLYPDTARCLRILLDSWGRRSWAADWLARGARIPVARAGDALRALERIELVEPDRYTVNFSGEPYYRLGPA